MHRHLDGTCARVRTHIHTHTLCVCLTHTHTHIHTVRVSAWQTDFHLELLIKITQPVVHNKRNNEWMLFLSHVFMCTCVERERERERDSESRFLSACDPVKLL